MNPRFVSLASFLALGLIGYAQTGFANDVSSLAGVYSSAHPVSMAGVKVQTNGYIEIDRTGRITAFEQEGESRTSPGSGCYRLATGTATNAGLQGRILTPGISPRGDAVYQTLAGDSDTFGILTDPAPSGVMRWFFHTGRQNNTITITGNRNVVNASNDTSYSISGPALASPTPEQLRGMICHADNKPEAVASGESVAPQASTISVPPALQDAVEQASLQRLGLAPGSRKAEIVLRWNKKIAGDPEILQFVGITGAGTPNAAAMSRAAVTGVLTATPEERSRTMELFAKILDGAPEDCGGLKSLPLVTNRYAIPTLSEDDLDDYFRLTFTILKRAARHAPLAHVTDEEHRQGEQAVMNQLGTLFKSNPEGAHDLAALLVNSQTATPTQWCNATRLSQRALVETPQPFRDWAVIGRNEAMLHQFALAAATAMPALSPASPPGVSPGYAERVSLRVRPNIVWMSGTQGLETVIAVHCLPSGTITSAAIERSSGDQDWDAAALRAVQHSDPMPTDADGRAPTTFTITLRPEG